MCKQNKHLIFCSCEIEKLQNKNKAREEALEVLDNQSEYHKTYYSWTLNKIVRKFSDVEKKFKMGELIPPVEIIDGILNAQMVVKELNSNPNFDFEFNANEGDELSISIEYKYLEIYDHIRPRLPFKSMSFVFEKDKWYFGYIDHFEYEQKVVKIGKVTVHNIT